MVLPAIVGEAHRHEFAEFAGSRKAQGIDDSHFFADAAAREAQPDEAVDIAFGVEVSASPRDLVADFNLASVVKSDVVIDDVRALRHHQEKLAASTLHGETPCFTPHERAADEGFWPAIGNPGRDEVQHAFGGANDL